MRSTLAEKLLVKVMNWTPEEVAQERPLIQAMANLKYDQYQQFSQGIRFTESLAQWLSQFNQTERTDAYNFIKSDLIFISSEQISHLVNICFSVKINPWLLGKAAQLDGRPKYLVKQNYNSNSYKEIKRSSLFLGVSDGAKIDQLRRSSGLNNEQVFSSYYISSEKRDDMLDELKNDGIKTRFNSIFLIDDFTGSGLSYYRLEDERPAGKIIKFLKLIFNIDRKEKDPSVLSGLVEKGHLDIHLLFYIARQHSIKYLYNEINKWKATINKDFSFSVEALQVISDDYNEKANGNQALINLSKKYISTTIIDRHFKKGRHDQFYLGFDECAIPLALHHNTPNNSLPILWWFPENEEFRGLFPRITRHRE